MEVQGHRGSRGTSPENSLPSFLEAIVAGADALELDLLATKDGIIVVHHNFSVNKKLCTQLNGTEILDESLIRSLTLSELKQIDCGAKKNDHYLRQVPQPGTLIPTLAELLELIRNCDHPNGKKIRLNLEIKREPKNPEYTFSPDVFAEKLIAVVEKAGFSDRVYYSSFDPESLAAIAALRPSAKLGFIFEEGIASAIEIGSSLGAVVLSPLHTLLQSKEDLAALLKGFKVVPWTVNEPERWAQLIELGVDGIITDYPADLIRFLKKPKHWVLNSSNPGKLAEFERLFKAYGASLTVSKVDLKEIHADPMMVVAHKASQVSEGVVVDDTSLEVEGEEVGIHVRSLLEHLSSYIGRKAVYRVLLAVAKEGFVSIYEGAVTGQIVEPKGQSGFGFDSVFLADGSKLTLAESKPDELNARAKAVKAFFTSEPIAVIPVISNWQGRWQD